MPTAMDVAAFFLASAPPEDELTNLKLQKLCSYAQAISLAYTNRPLFEEDIEAWQHGPVVPSVYQEFKSHGRAPIASLVSLDSAMSVFNQEQRFVLQTVWAAYGRFTAWALRDQSHWDFPGDFNSRGEIISKQAIANAFKNAPVVQHMRETQSISDIAHALVV